MIAKQHYDGVGEAWQNRLVSWGNLLVAALTMVLALGGVAMVNESRLSKVEMRLDTTITYAKIRNDNQDSSISAMQAQAAALQSSVAALTARIDALVLQIATLTRAIEQEQALRKGGR